MLMCPPSDIKDMHTLFILSHVNKSHYEKHASFCFREYVYTCTHVPICYNTECQNILLPTVIRCSVSAYHMLNMFCFCLEKKC